MGRIIFCTFLLLLSGCAKIKPDCHYAIGSHATSLDARYDAAAFLVNCDTGSIESDEFIFVRKYSNSDSDLRDRNWIPVGGIGADDAGPILEWKSSVDLFVKFDRKSLLVIDRNFQYENKDLKINIHQDTNMTDIQYKSQKLKRLEIERDNNALSDFWIDRLGISKTSL